MIDTTFILLNFVKDYGLIVSGILVSIFSLYSALVGLGWGISKFRLYIYNSGFGEKFRKFGTPRWKGYKWYRSEKWNMENTFK